MQLTPEQLGQLINQHWKPLLVWVGCCHGAEDDVVQESFVRLAAMDPAPDAPTAWLYVVARNLAITARTSHRRRTLRHQSVAIPESVSATIDQNLVTSDLQSALERLPVELRQVVVARVWGELSFEQIGELAGSSAATCWRRYQAAIEALRSIYGVPCPNSTK